jgi:hypothetical protein
VSRYTKDNGTGFTSWLNLNSGEAAAEWSDPAAAFFRLSVEDAAIFGELAPGESTQVGGVEYIRHE